MLAEIKSNGRWIDLTDEPVDRSEEGPDPKDFHLWQLLRTERAAVLVTGDKDLRDFAPSWATVMAPREWMEWAGLA